jgi:hypothetical protein
LSARFPTWARKSLPSIVAKHEGMKKSKATSNPNPHSDVFIKGPAYHKTGNEVIRELKKLMDAAERPSGQALAQKDFGCLIGAPRSTIHDWCHGSTSNSAIDHAMSSFSMERGASCPIYKTASWLWQSSKA